VQGENWESGEFVVKTAWRGSGERQLVHPIVECDAAALATIERETDRHMNFYVSQETEIFIGRQLGAEVIISVSMTRAGANWRLEVHAVTVENRATERRESHGAMAVHHGGRKDQAATFVSTGLAFVEQ